MGRPSLDLPCALVVDNGGTPAVEVEIRWNRKDEGSRDGSGWGWPCPPSGPGARRLTPRTPPEPWTGTLGRFGVATGVGACSSAGPPRKGGKEGDGGGMLPRRHGLVTLPAGAPTIEVPAVPHRHYQMKKPL
ncbi:hypothetical protein CSOJ01_05030 [Colletotrichum sojae]|uniref:Uncharacterized protein n=1 Tax=Colletotrichum sojae TaxID=2175907 RepID=A0A8H6MY83_9PEZI|nr:hypothetical protein CSOJ01_05030 [Colletotrichum sojae]